MKSRWRLLRRKYIRLPFVIFKSAITDTIRQDGIEHAGYLAFLSILSFFPFVIFIFSILTVFGESESGARLIHILVRALPYEIQSSITPRIEEIISGPPQGILTIAIIGIIWTASSAVEGMRTILNRAYRVKSPPPYVAGRLLSIVQFIIITLIISATVILFVLTPAILKKLEYIFSVDFMIDYDQLYWRQFIILSILLLGTAFLYQQITDIKQKISETIPGSIISIVLWILSIKLFSFYIDKFNQFSLVYGSLGGIIGILMLFYLISLSFIIGAEFNYHFKRVYNARHYHITEFKKKTPKLTIKI